MMVERSAGRVGSRSKWLNRILALLLLSFVLFIIFGNRFYDTIQRPKWTEAAAAKSIAIKQLNVKNVSRVERFIGDKVYSIVYAVNTADESVIVWVWDGGIHMKLASAGLTKEEIKRTALAEHPGIRILRINPGKLREDYVWEVFYTKTDEGVLRYYYDYYRFEDGTKLDTYRLARPSKY